MIDSKVNLRMFAVIFVANIFGLILIYLEVKSLNDHLNVAIYSSDLDRGEEYDVVMFRKSHPHIANYSLYFERSGNASKLIKLVCSSELGEMVIDNETFDELKPYNLDFASSSILGASVSEYFNREYMVIVISNGYTHTLFGKRIASRSKLEVVEVVDYHGSLDDLVELKFANE